MGDVGVRICSECGRDVEPGGRWARGLCHACYQRRTRAGDLPDPEVWADYNELRWLIDSGESPERAAARVGVTPAAAARHFYRHGHIELARQFGRLAKAVRA